MSFQKLRPSGQVIANSRPLPGEEILAFEIRAINLHKLPWQLWLHTSYGRFLPWRGWDDLDEFIAFGEALLSSENVRDVAVFDTFGGAK